LVRGEGGGEEDWLARGYMPAHQHCELFYTLAGDLIGSTLK